MNMIERKTNNMQKPTFKWVPPAKKAPKRWGLRFLALFIIMIFGLAVGLVIAELAARRFLPEVSDTFIVKMKDATCKYHHPATFREPLETPDNNAYRIMFIGDSFTYGFCNIDFVFPKLVGQYFKSGAVDGLTPINVQTFNLGVSSYSPSIECVILRDYAPKLLPNLVVIAVDDSDAQDDFIYKDMVIKDISGMPLAVYPGLPGVPKYLLPLARQSKLLRVTCGILSQKAEQLAPKSKTEEEIAFDGCGNRYGHYLPDSEQKWAPALERTIGYVDKMVKYCRKRDIEVALVNYPYPPAVTQKYGVTWRGPYSMHAGG